MAQVRIPVEVLPPPNKDGDHVLQFRVVSEDRNFISAWSNLYIVKSTGQYRPLESSYTYVSDLANGNVSVTWDTPTVYNFYGNISSSAALIASGSVVVHNHTQNYKQHDTDIFIKWNPSDPNSYYEYHDSVASDSTTINITAGSTSVRIIGGVATHNVPIQNINETDVEYRARLDAHVNTVLSLFKVFDTGIKAIT